jgi:thioredoxin-like negative regulator of GroEL
MLGLSTAIVLQTALLTPGGGTYEAAYARADSQNKPLLILVGAAWCPGCQVMKNETIPSFHRRGGLSKVVYVQVDADARPELTRQLLRGNSIPQLILYTKAGKYWRRSHLTGAQPASEIQTFLKREITTGRQVAEKVQQQRVAKPQ